MRVLPPVLVPRARQLRVARLHGCQRSASVLQLFRQTCTRALLLVVALGYGIVRPKLLLSEWTSVAAVSTVYFIAGQPSSFFSFYLLFLLKN